MIAKCKAIPFLLAGLLLPACPEKSEQAMDAARSQAVDAAASQPAQPAQPALPQLEEAEPNDKTTQAMKIDKSCQVQATLEKAGGKKKQAADWYLLLPASPRDAGVLAVTVSPVAGEDVSLLFLDADRNRLFYVDSGGVGEGEEFPNLALGRGVYLGIRGAPGGSGGAYLLTVKLGDQQPGWEVESNGRWSQANELAIGGEVKGYLGSKRDEDWYRVPLSGLPTGSILRAELTAVDQVRFELQVLDGSERRPLLSRRSRKTGEPVTVRNLGLRPEEEAVYLVVKSAWIPGPTKGKYVRTCNPRRSYSLVVSSESGGDDLEREPDDDAEHAFSLQDGQKVRGYLSHPDDVDWYVIQVENPSLLAARLRVPGRLDLQLYVVDPAKVKQRKDFALLRINDGKVGEPEVLVNCALQPGPNYLRVEGAWKLVDGKYVRDFFSLDDTYVLSVNLRADEGREEREPNNTAERASEIRVGQSVRGYLHPRADVDFYRLDLSGQEGPRNTVLELQGIPKLDVALALLGPERDEQGRLKTRVTVDQGKGEQAERLSKELMPGVYHVKVWGRPRSESNATDQYLLTVTQP